MKNRNCVWCSFLLVAVFAFSCGAVSKRAKDTAGLIGGPASLQGIALKWKPRISAALYDIEKLDMYPGMHFVIGEFTDSRDDPALIGQAVEDKRVRTTTVPVTTSTRMLRWWTNGIIESLKIFELDAAYRGRGLHIEGEITTASVSEDYSYQGKAAMRISIRNSDDMLIWEGTTQGNTALDGPSYNHQSYSECMSNALIDAVYNLLTDKSFSDAIRKSR